VIPKTPFFAREMLHDLMNDEPPLFSMDPPFPEMNGKKILVSTSTGSEVAELMTYRKKHKGLFGIKIRFEGATSRTQALYLEEPLLSEDEIRSIKAVDHQDYKFTIELPRLPAPAVSPAI
jgi:hypothetical protein